MVAKFNGKNYGQMFAGMGSSRGNMYPKIQNPDSLRAALYPHMFMDTDAFVDHFHGDTLRTDLWTSTGDTGTTAFAIPTTGTVAGSIIRGNTATDDNEFVSIKGHAVFRGDNNAGFSVRFRTSVVALTCFEMGFVDPLSDDTLPAINDIDTPSITNGAVTVATVVWDQAQTLQTAALVADGDSTYATSKVNIGTWLPTVNTFYTVTIQTFGDSVACWIFDTSTPSRPIPVVGTSMTEPVATITNGFEGGTLVQPWFIAGNRTSDNAVVDIDYIAAWQDAI